jgi:DNA-binding response OmpR family regulator
MEVSSQRETEAVPSGVESRGTIVVCEDDELTLELLIENLEADRYHALAAPTRADALRFCRYSQPDLLLLDLALPDGFGLDVLRRIRGSEGAAAEFDRGLPVIVLSGRGADCDRVRGLQAGADDYLVKPFHYPELLARIENALARRGRERAGPIQVGPLRIDSATRRVQVGSREIRLANKEFELLRALAAEPSRVFTKRELLRDVWGYELAARTRTLDSHASRLRRKLDPERGRFVVNCWGVGYRLVEAA